MNGGELDALFRGALAAIDSGDVGTLQRLLQQHPELVRERLRKPGDWLRAQIGPALDGFFKDGQAGSAGAEGTTITDRPRLPEANRASALDYFPGATASRRTAAVRSIGRAVP